MTMPTRLFAVPSWRIALAFAILFGLYQSAEGVGARLLGNAAVQDTLMILSLLLAWPVGRWLLEWRGFSAYGLEWSRRVPLWLAAGLALSIAVKVGGLAVGMQLGIYIRSAEPAAGLSLAGVGFALLATVVASIAEDIITRGFWWRVGFVSATPLRFVLATSTIYLLNHVFRLSNGPHEWFMLFCLGIAYASAMVRTGSLWAAVGLHWGWNLANALIDGLVSLDGNAALTPILSGVSNLLMALIVLTAPSIWRRTNPAAR